MRAFTQLRPTLCYAMDYNPPESSVRGILQARILELVSMPSSDADTIPLEGKITPDWEHLPQRYPWEKVL